MNTSKKWLAEFLLSRLLSKKTIAKPLYSYEMTVQEYQSLSETLISDKASILHPITGTQWSACFCIFVSERYRREYDASEGGWSWQGYEKIIDEHLSSTQIRQIVTQGLRFWNRPIRHRENSNDYLGSLFAEGGLPIPLLRSERHGFGRAIKSGIKNYDKTKHDERSLTDLIKDHQQYFPTTFRHIDTYILLASVVESLMILAKNHDLESQDDPATFLDEHQPNWRKQFPLPIGEINGRALVNEWLKNAGVKQRELKDAVEHARSFTCHHVLAGQLSDWHLDTTIFLPRQYSLSTTNSILSSRLEFIFFEGSTRVLNAGILYGKLEESCLQITVNFPRSEYKIRRKSPEKPLTLQLFSNGVCIHTIYLQNSDLDLINSPLVCYEGDERELIANSSAYIKRESALVSIPSDAVIEPYQEQISVDQYGARWYRITSDIIIKSLESLFTIHFRDGIGYEKPVLKGRLVLYDTIPNLTYYGMPDVVVPESIDNSDEQLSILLNENTYQGKPVYGCYFLRAKTVGGVSVFTKKIGILPRDLIINSVCSTRTSPAFIYLHTQETLSVMVNDKSLQVDVIRQGGCLNVALSPKIGATLPSSVLLELKSDSVECEPAVIRLPYPQEGASIFDENGHHVEKNIISLDELLGMRIQLTSSTHRKQDFYMVMDLLSTNERSLRRIYKFNVIRQSISISLHSFYYDLMQILSAVPDQDATVRIRIETDQPIRKFEITHYAGKVESLQQSGLFEISTYQLNTEKSIYPIGINLSDPARSSIVIPERLSAGIQTDTFEIPHKMQTKGPWLIAPASESDIKFRPVLWLTDDMRILAPEDNRQPKSLHLAASSYHPSANPNVFIDVIATMADDMSHGSWEYLSELKDKYSFLPLSVFKAWHALSQNTQALAVSVIRLDMEQRFCEKFINELAVIWEEITVEEWQKAINLNRAYLMMKGIPEVTVNSLIYSKLQSMGGVIPIFKSLIEFLMTSQLSAVTKLPEEYLFPAWYQELRRRQAGDENWPEILGEKLNGWILNLDNAEVFVSVVNMKFEKAVVFFPVFMAYLSAGKVTLSNLNSCFSEIRFAVRVLSDFDRESWYEPVYALVLSNLVANKNKD